MHRIVCICWKTASRVADEAKAEGEVGTQGSASKTDTRLLLSSEKCRKLSLHEGTAQWSMLLFGQLPNTAFPILHVSYY